MFWNHSTHEGRNSFAKGAVIAACERTLASIKTSRDEAHERQIARQMGKRRWLAGRNFTRDEAIARLKNDDDNLFSSWSMADALHGRQEGIATEILSAARHSVGDTFELSRSEFNALIWAAVEPASIEPLDAAFIVQIADSGSKYFLDEVVDAARLELASRHPSAGGTDGH